MEWKVSFPVTMLRNQIKACNIIVHVIFNHYYLISGTTANVTYSYEAEDSDELSLDGGRANGVAGVFPSEGM